MTRQLTNEAPPLPTEKEQDRRMRNAYRELIEMMCHKFVEVSAFAERIEVPDFNTEPFEFESVSLNEHGNLQIKMSTTLTSLGPATDFVNQSWLKFWLDALKKILPRTKRRRNENMRQERARKANEIAITSPKSGYRKSAKVRLFKVIRIF